MSSSSSSGSESEMEVDCIPPDIRSEAESAMVNLLPAKSKEKYMKVYENFMSWKNKRKVKIFSETVFLAYFSEIAKTKKPSTLWATYSMLKSTVSFKNGIDLKNYRNLSRFLKRQSSGYHTTKSEIFTSENIQQFLTEAPDDKYLVSKVAMIVGISGACRSVELCYITTKDIDFLDNKAMITLQDTKTTRIFVVQGEFFTYVKKYDNLRRSANIKSDRFFLHFENGKCKKQPIGRHQIAKIPSQIATYLNLSNPEHYTGHCFRRSSVTLKKQEGRNSEKVAEGYIEDSATTTTSNAHLETSSEVQGHTCIEVSIENDTDINIKTEAESDPLTTCSHLSPRPILRSLLNSQFSEEHIQQSSTASNAHLETSSEVQRHGGWKSEKVADGCIEVSIENGTDINIKTEAESDPLTTCQYLSPQPSSSEQHIQPSSTASNAHLKTSSEVQAQISNVNVSGKSITFSISNCPKMINVTFSVN